MTVEATSTPDLNLPGLIPEFLVVHLERSLVFWCDVVGFRELYARPDERFAMLTLGSAAVMLEERQAGTRQWLTAELLAPLGRGVNFQIEVPAIEPILHRLAAERWPLFMAPETKWYRAGGIDLGVRQFLVQDPDGYLLRLSEKLETRRTRP